MSLVLWKTIEPSRGLQTQNGGADLSQIQKLKRTEKQQHQQQQWQQADLEQIYLRLHKKKWKMAALEWQSVEFGRIRKLYKSFLYPLSCVSTRFFRMHAIYIFLSDCTKEQALSSTEINFGAYGLFDRSLIYHKIDNKHNIFIV